MPAISENFVSKVFEQGVYIVSKMKDATRMAMRFTEGKKDAEGKIEPKGEGRARVYMVFAE